jgi:hypothetical protein
MDLQNRGLITMEELLKGLPTPEWLREMEEHFAENGEVRAEDLDRIIGDPSRGVAMTQEPDCLTAFRTM